MEHWQISLVGHQCDLYLLEQEDGHFQGAIASEEYGTSQITSTHIMRTEDKKVRTLEGIVDFAGHLVKLQAHDDGKKMSGYGRLNLFVGASFTGMRMPDVATFPASEKENKRA